jgi:hypothetical protein
MSTDLVEELIVLQGFVMWLAVQLWAMTNKICFLPEVEYSVHHPVHPSATEEINGIRPIWLRNSDVTNADEVEPMTTYFNSTTHLLNQTLHLERVEVGVISRLLLET